ncbi:MAG TPA: hypothetical protein H9726_05775 [Candidatus Borkfalkia avicola]|uniref:Ppx/GppA phosphatase N-terminal domain-containing protein n=1 Tax=Candidatus Borkfalkia avicola TaxID=2838503 RepID=A0A9D2D7F6_9FIRM|nr:hypothetical protein [Candidatus Borkfalkia avicola]
MRYSVIDISSTGVSMIVAEARGKEAEVVFKDRANLTLLHYLNGRDLSARGIEKVVAAVAAMKEKCSRLGTDELLLISTAALRAIGNFEEVGAAVLGGTGIPVNAVDGRKEAYCDLVANRAYAAFDRAAIIDIGGASIEVCDINEKGGRIMVSLPFGLLNLHEKFVSRIQPDEEEGKNIRRYLSRKADKAGMPGEGVFDTVILVGAAGQALCGVYGEYFDAAENRAMTAKKFKKLAKHLLCGKDRSKVILDAAPDKLYSVGVASVVARTFVKRFGAERILVSERGVKEGYLQLVLEGKERGAYYDNASGKAVFPPRAAAQPSAERPAAKPAAEKGGTPAPAKKTDAKRRAPVKKTDSAGAAKEGVPAQPKRRGRPPVRKADEPEKAPAQPKRRGRPPKQKTGDAEKAPAQPERTEK